MYGKTGYASKKDYDRARYLHLKTEREKSKPPHPISLLSETEKAYIAGIIDGEGAIYAAKVRKTHYPTVSVHITHEGLVRWLTEKTGSQKVHAVNRKKGDYKSVLKTQFLYRASGKTAQMLCEALLPYLKIKTDHAKVVCAFPVDARLAPGHILGQNVIYARHQLAEQLCALNDNRYRRRHKTS